MKKDLQELLNIITQYKNAFTVSSINLHSEKEDAKMHEKIKKIANKHNLKY